MAVLQQPVNNGNAFADMIGDDLASAGTWVATILDIKDEFGIQRQRFQSTEMEMVDLTTFLFGFRDPQGAEHRVASKRMKISGNEKSSLFGFLKSLLGRAPQYGWDYCTLKGTQCLLTVEHIQRRDGSGVFAAIAALSPVPQGMGRGGPQAADLRPQTADYRPQTADHRPQTMDYGPQTADYRPQTAGGRPQTADPRPQTMDYGPQAGNWAPPVAAAAPAPSVAPVAPPARLQEDPVPF